MFLFATLQLRLSPPRRAFVFASPFKVLHLLSLQMGWGSELFGSVFGFLFLGLFCAKTARNAARFSFFVFLLGVWASVVRRFSEVLLGLRVLIGQVLFYELFSPNWPFLCSGFLLQTARNAGLFSVFCFSLLPSWL